MAGLPAKKLVFNAEAAALPRRPFAPVEAAPLPVSSSLLSTPVRATAISVAEDENRTPVAAKLPVPKTPKTVSLPMQMVATPLPTPIKEDMEYSFEERRAGFLLVN